MKSKFTFFWLTQSPFSQWHPAIFTVNGKTFTSAEQYMMFQKAVLFRDRKIATEILDMNKNEKILVDFLSGEMTRDQIISDAKNKKAWSDMQAKIKAAGRRVSGYNETTWLRNRERIVEEGNIAKFSQNEDLKTKLLNTGDTILVEASKYDKIWGIGLTEDDPRAWNENTWNGLNLLGKALTKVREKLKSVS